MRPSLAMLAEADGQLLGKRAGDHVGAVGVVGVVENDPVARHDVDHPPEAQLDLVHVLVDVGVVELDVVDDEQFRQVVDELAALVEERGVVLVALDHVIRRIVELRALAEVVGQAADHVAGGEAGGLEQPRHQRGRRRLSVCAGDDDVVASAQEEKLQHLRQRKVRQLAVEDFLDLRVAAPDSVADHDEVRVGREVFRAVATAQRDAFLLQKRRHRRINVLVGTGDDVALVAQRGGDRAHRRAADSEEVKVLGIREHERPQGSSGRPRESQRARRIDGSSGCKPEEPSSRAWRLLGATAGAAVTASSAVATTGRWLADRRGGAHCADRSDDRQRDHDDGFFHSIFTSFLCSVDAPGQIAAARVGKASPPVHTGRRKASEWDAGGGQTGAGASLRARSAPIRKQAVRCRVGSVAERSAPDRTEGMFRRAAMERQSDR